MVLLRKVIGDALRARRLAQHRTLREVSTAANVSLGYLSEIERGHKEASSELLASICDALGARLSEMLGDVSITLALAEQMGEAFVDATSTTSNATSSASSSMASTALASNALAANGLSSNALATNAMTSTSASTDTAVTVGHVTVQVHSDGPLRTTLTTKRTPPGQRHTDAVFAA